MIKIDLRSDTVTRPTPDMYNAINKALLGDDVFEDDPTITPFLISNSQREKTEEEKVRPS